MSGLIGMDIGGTFTDCVVVDDAGRTYAGKSPTTPADYSLGMVGALRSAADRAGLEPERLWRDCGRFVHGTTIATNAILERTGATLALLTTLGHEDVLYIGRGGSPVAGLPDHLKTWQQKHRKPVPLASKKRTRGITERIDSSGKVVIPLDEEGTRAIIRELVADGVDAIAVGLLWSFVNPEHELRVGELIRDEAPGVFVTLSAELSPKWGEYERLNGAVINSYIGPKSVSYLGVVTDRVADEGFGGAAGVMQCAGGYMPIDQAQRAPLLTLDSGPGAGVIGSKLLAEALGLRDVIATDMGGTSFDAGIILGGQPITRATGLTDGFEYHVSRVDISSIGSGGGSIVGIDPVTETLRVGPRSAGAVPGPACYGRGGTEPTVTDADVLVGMVDPERFMGGRAQLDLAAAESAIASVADAVGLTPLECAAGIQRIVDHQMAEALRRVTIESGLDPRDFWIFAYGGAGPVHASSYSRELGARGVIVPQGDFASVWSAWGAAGSQVVRVFERAFSAIEPFPARDVADAYAELEAKAVAELREAGFADADIALERGARMKWRFQVYEADVAVTASTLDEAGMQQMVDDFAERYEILFGRNTAYRAAGVEIASLSVTARGLVPPPAFQHADPGPETEPVAEAIRPSRPVLWWELGEHRETAIYSGPALRPRDAFEGPAIVESPGTSVVVRPGQRARVDLLGNVVIEL